MSDLSERAEAVIRHTVDVQTHIIMDLLLAMAEEGDSITTKVVVEDHLRYAFAAYEHGTAGFPPSETAPLNAAAKDQSPIEDRQLAWLPPNWAKRVYTLLDKLNNL